VQGAANEKYHATFTKEVTGAVDVDYKSTLNHDVTGTAIENYHDTRTVTVTLAETENFNNTLTTTVTDLTTQTYNKGLNLTVNSALTDEKFTASKKQEVTGTYDVTVSDKYTLTVKGAEIVNTAAKKETTSGSWFNVKWALGVDTTIGLKMDNYLGGKIGLQVGFFSTVTLGFKFDFNGAVNFKTVGLEADVKALEEKVAVATLKATTTTMKAIATGMEAHAMSMMPAGFRVM
ncbi:MAG TPA: hypothetical protein VLS89_05050, partial [Candidatus Nanopelagicales bacterium]|nr:hypothetical protein [Candidatus Nanopelagicales bacterium]